MKVPIDIENEDVREDAEQAVEAEEVAMDELTPEE